MAVKDEEGFRYEIALDLLKRMNFSQFNSKFGLIVFGAEGKDNGNEDISIPIRPGFNVDRDILAHLNILLPFGESPLAQAIATARNVLPKNTDNHIILISAGMETCGGDPLDAAIKLKNERIISRIFCIGFGEDNLLQDIASNTEGTYYNINQFKSLKNELFQAIYGYEYDNDSNRDQKSQLAKIGYRSFIKASLQYPAYGTKMLLRDMEGNDLNNMNYWRGIIEDISPGYYVLMISNSDQIQIDSIKIEPQEFLIRNYEFEIETGNLTFQHLIKGAPEGRAYGTFTVVKHENGETVFTGTQWSGELQNLPIGRYIITASNSSIIMEQEAQVTERSSAETIFNFELSTGRVAYRCFLDPEKRKIAYGTVVKIFRLPIEELAFENSEQWRGTTSLIPPGDYRIEGEYQGVIKKDNVYIGPDSTINYDFVFNVKKIKLSYRCYRNKQNSPANSTILEIFNSSGALVERLQGWRGSSNLTEGSYLLRAQYQGKIISRDVQLLLQDGATQDQEFYFTQ